MFLLFLKTIKLIVSSDPGRMHLPMRMSLCNKMIPPEGKVILLRENMGRIHRKDHLERKS
jgi:hypothetical protein